MDRFTICVLLYGGDEYAWLHNRCLESLMTELPREGAEFRIGLNDMTCVSTSMLMGQFQQHFGDANVIVYGNDNIGKYPRMREMLTYADRPYVMWFDDDSYLKPGECGKAWLDEICRLQEATPGVLGSVYRQRWRPQRVDWIERHPKFRGKPLDPENEIFVTGGWWVAPLAMLRELDWPQKELYHNGGDRLLGTLATQNGYRLIQFNKGVAINADAAGLESKAVRRGISTRGLGD